MSSFPPPDWERAFSDHFLRRNKREPTGDEVDSAWAKIEERRAKIEAEERRAKIEAEERIRLKEIEVQKEIRLKELELQAKSQASSTNVSSTSSTASAGPSRLALRPPPAGPSATTASSSSTSSASSGAEVLKLAMQLGQQLTLTDSTGLMATFFSSLSAAPFDNITHSIALPNGCAWLGQQNYGSVIYVRDCYLTLADIIFSDATYHQAHLLLGTPGTGKSFFLGFFMWLLLRRNPKTPIVYYVCPEADTSRAICYVWVNGKFSRGTWMDQDVAATLAMSETWLLCDALSPMMTDVRAHVVVVSSPKRERYHDFRKAHCLLERTLYMELWTLAELMAGAHVIRRVERWPLTDEIVAARFEIYGGSGRSVLEQVSAPKGASSTYRPTAQDARAQAMESIGNELNSIDSLETIKSAILSIGDQANGRQDPHKLIHWSVVDETDPRAYECVFASRYTEAAVVTRFQQRMKQVLGDIVSASESSIYWGQLRGALFENMAIECISRGGTFVFRLMYSSGGCKKEESHAVRLRPHELQMYEPASLKQTHTQAFLSSLLSAAKKRPEASLAVVPRNRNFGTIDCACLAESLNLLIQPTFGSTHPPKEKPLRPVLRVLYGDSNVALVPVRPSITHLQGQHASDVPMSSLSGTSSPSLSAPSASASASASPASSISSSSLSSSSLSSASLLPSSAPHYSQTMLDAMRSNPPCLAFIVPPGGKLPEQPWELPPDADESSSEASRLIVQATLEIPIPDSIELFRDDPSSPLSPSSETSSLSTLFSSSSLSSSSSSSLSTTSSASLSSSSSPSSGSSSMHVLSVSEFCYRLKAIVQDQNEPKRLRVPSKKTMCSCGFHPSQKGCMYTLCAGCCKTKRVKEGTSAKCPLSSHM